MGGKSGRYYNIIYLNIYILFCIVILYYLAYIILFACYFNVILYTHLLVGDKYMDVLYLRFGLCALECFSLFCRCISTFLRMFCNILSSHFLMLMFCDFLYFAII